MQDWPLLTNLVMNSNQMPGMIWQNWSIFSKDHHWGRARLDLSSINQISTQALPSSVFYFILSQHGKWHNFLLSMTSSCWDIQATHLMNLTPTSQLQSGKPPSLLICWSYCILSGPVTMLSCMITHRILPSPCHCCSPLHSDPGATLPWPPRSSL